MNKIFVTRMDSIVSASKKALRELDAERFNSNTLRELYTDKRFFSDKPDVLIVKSRYSGEPVKIRYNLRKTISSDEIHYEYNFYNENTSEICGKKNFFISKGIRRMKPGNMSSDDSDLQGVGIREDECQIKEALRLGIKSIPRISMPEATLFHLKMGFRPIEDLRRISSLKDFYGKFNVLTRSYPMADEKYFTPIVRVKKGLFGKRYFLDTNTTLVLANLRIIKHELRDNPCKRRVKYIPTQASKMVLDGRNLETWKSMINGRGFDIKA